MKTIESIMEIGLAQYAAESLKKLFAPISFSRHIEDIAIVKEMIIKTSKQSLSKNLHALAERSEACSKLHQIIMPVIILVRKKDEITPTAIALSMHEKIKGSDIHIIDHAGHLSNLENPDQFNEQLKKFLKK